VPLEVTGEPPLEMPLMTGEEEDGHDSKDGHEPTHTGQALRECQFRVTIVDTDSRIDREAKAHLCLGRNVARRYLLKFICKCIVHLLLQAEYPSDIVRID
jgi:hypothetical protein